MTLVAPGVPKGTPAVTITRSPRLAKPAFKAWLLAIEVMSSKFVASGECTQYTPQTQHSRRAVDRSGVMLTIGTGGRSREARIVVDPDVVNVMIAFADSVPAI